MDENLIPISALQHYAYCPRQCALIHLEQAWENNKFTAQGNRLHQRVDSGAIEERKNIRYERSVYVQSYSLGLTGKLDLLEIHQLYENMVPVEYKRGSPKEEDWDRIQLCAQALCLEEMRNITIKEGAIWYFKTRQRENVELSIEIRQKTLDIIEDVHKLFAFKTTPKELATEEKCNSCSLIDICCPDWLRTDESQRYVNQIFS